MNKNLIKNEIIVLIRHLLPSILVIFLFQVIAIEMYFHNPIQKSWINFSLWIFTQAVGSFILGAISDRFCRKTILISTQIAGLIIIAIIFLNKNFSDWWSISALGLLFAPTPIARSALIDNFPNQSKVKIIGITFIFLFLPWCFYMQIVNQPPHSVIGWVTILLILNLFITIFLFQDLRDLKPHKTDKKLFNKSGKLKGIVTLFSLIPAQTVFFISDSFFEETAQSAPYFTALGVGVLIGTVTSIFYRKTPHSSVLSTCYGVGFVFCLLSVISAHIIGLNNSELTILVMLFATLGGFYLPFVYDIVLSSVSANHRGAACGILGKRSGVLLK